MIYGKQGLWGVIQSVSEAETDASREMKDNALIKEEKKKKMKDAKALHIIQLSCGREILDEISHFKTAKSAWNHLSNQYGHELKARRDTDQGTCFFVKARYII